MLIIYKITNKINGKVYIGQTTKPLEKRWYQHCHKSSGCRFLKHAIGKYGVENFTIEQIDSASCKDDLNLKEQYWIDFYNSVVPNGYNLKSGGNRPNYSMESRQRMSDNHADVSGVNNPRFGCHLSEETKQKISNSHKGKTLSLEHREKMLVNSPKRKVVLNLDTGELFMSSRQAERKFGLSHGSISRVCRGEGCTAAGYHWQYYKEVV